MLAFSRKQPRGTEISVLLLLVCYTALTTLINADDESSIPTAVNKESIPFFTGKSLETTTNPLFSFMSGPMKNILLTQHVEGASPGSHTNVGNLVIQAFHAESGKMLYKKLWPSCLNDITLLFKDQTQRVVDLNGTHAIVLCSKTALNANNTRTAVPTVYTMDVETGDETWFAEARDPLHNNEVVNSTVNGNLFVEVAVPEEGLFAMSNLIAPFVLNLQERTFLCYNPKNVLKFNNGRAKAYCNKSKAFVYSTDDTMYAMRVPTREMIWHHQYWQPDEALVTVGSQPFDIHHPRTATVVPVLLVQNNRSSMPLVLVYMDTATGATVHTTQFVSELYPWFQNDNALDATFSFSGPFLRKGTSGFHRDILIMNVENIHFGEINPNSEPFEQTCGVLGLDVNGGPVWTSGFVTDAKPIDNAIMTEVVFECQWRVNPTSSFGWLVRHGTGNYNNPIVTLVDIGTGATLATAAPSTVSLAEVNKESTHRLYLPLATVYNNDLGISLEQKKISSTLMDDILLVKYPMKGVASTKAIMVGIRLDTKTSNTTKPQFRGSFKIDATNAQGMVDSTHYTIKPRLTQRFDNNTMLVPAFDRVNGQSHMILVDIAKFESNPDGGYLLPLLIVAAVCVFGVVVLSCIVAFAVRRCRRRHIMSGEGEYQQLQERTSW